MESKTADAYFTIPELEAAFRLVTDEASAKRLAIIWRYYNGEVVVGDRVVAIPFQNDLPNLAGPDERTFRDETGTEQVPAELGSHDHELEMPIAQALVGFTGAELDLLARSSPEVRQRFDRLGVRFATTTVDTPALWTQMLAFLKALGPLNTT
jgi:hypothetical protein